MEHNLNNGKSYTVTQIGVVVKDIRKAMETYHRTLGWGPWNVYELKGPLHHHTEVRGESVEYSMIIAETNAGSVDFELIEPLDGPSIYKEFLEKHGEGVHHIACMGNGDNYEKSLQMYLNMGMTVQMSGSIGEDIRYYYLDSEPLLKIVIESGSGHAGHSVTPSWVYPPQE
jgi:methylmalonyl-CoA/ethylmalonyl-CoA epimerase